MRRINGISACVCLTCLTLAMAVPSVRADLVQEAADKVSVGQYRTYQVDIESMGLGRYGGPEYNQGYRNRDGWIGGGTLGNDEARLYLFEQFSALGLAAEVQGRYKNVVAEWPGVERPEEIYIVCGHFDTTSNGERPGGDDNASGTAGVLEAARVLTQYELRSTLRFIGFNAEEDWMKGSQDYVDSVVVANDEDVKGVINLDMILRPGWDGDPYEPEDLDIDTDNTPLCLAWFDIFVAAVAQYAPSLAIDPASPDTEYWYASDQGPFIEAGYPALLAIENTAEEVWFGPSNVYYHEAEDASDGLANDPSSPSGITYNYEFATDVVRATVATMAMEAGVVAASGPGFSEYQGVATNGAHDLEFFTIDDVPYLAVANGRNDATHDVNSIIYQWDGASFVKYQSIPTRGASDAEFFAIDSEHYLAVANRRDDATHDVESKVYRWDGAAFVEFQSIPTHGARDWEFFTIAGEAYLAVANMRDDETHHVDSILYRWDGTGFVAFQAIATHGAAAWESFTIGDEVYLAVANRYIGSTRYNDSTIYRWDGTAFVEFQSLPTRGAADWAFFTLDDASYLAVANQYDGATYDVDSRIYKWNGAGFEELQFIPTHGANDWEFFTVDGLAYLVVANTCSDHDHDIKSRIYAWNGTRFVECAAIPTHGAKDWEAFTIDSHSYLGVANSTDDTTSAVASMVYRYDQPGVGGMEGDVDLSD